jgi:hypothetical protein
LSEQTKDVFHITEELGKVKARVSLDNYDEVLTQQYVARSLLTGNEFTFKEIAFSKARFVTIPEEDLDLYILAGVGEVVVSKYEQALQGTATALDNNDVQTAAFWTKHHYHNGKRTDEEDMLHKKYMTPGRTGKIIRLLKEAGMLSHD